MNKHTLKQSHIHSYIHTQRKQGIAHTFFTTQSHTHTYKQTQGYTHIYTKQLKHQYTHGNIINPRQENARHDKH